MRTYENSLKTYWDNYSVLETAKKDGRTEGIKAGIIKGRTEGRTEGIKETARKMLRKGIAFEIIKEVTGLNDDELMQLK